MPNQLRLGLTRHFTEEQLDRLCRARVGIAGAGGLGSNAAMLLARCGVENMVVIDHDHVEASNLNRQHYWPGQIGMAKVNALAGYLLALNPDMQLTVKNITLNTSNLPGILPLAGIWVEALDQPEDKKLFVEAALGAGCQVAAASGIAGYGGPPLAKKRLGSLTIVGDFATSINSAPPLAPKVAQAAAMLADCVLEFILESDIEKNHADSDFSHRPSGHKQLYHQ